MNANWRFASAKVQNKLFISVSLEISHKICRGNEEHISFYWSIKYGSSSMWSGWSDYNEIVDDTLEADVHEISDA